MRAYITGTLSLPDEKVKFLLSDLWFADEDFDGDLGDNGSICLSGWFCETADRDGISSTRWKGIDIEKYPDDRNEMNNLDELKKILNEKHLINASGFIGNDDVDFVISEIKFVQGYDEWIFPKDRIVDVIKFITD